MGLRHKSFYSKSKSLQHIFALVMHAKQDGFGVGRVMQDLPCSIQAVKNRHGDVQNHHIRTEALRQSDSVLSVLGLRVHVETLALKEHLHAVTNDLMVIS